MAKGQAIVLGRGKNSLVIEKSPTLALKLSRFSHRTRRASARLRGLGAHAAARAVERKDAASVARRFDAMAPQLRATLTPHLVASRPARLPQLSSLKISAKFTHACCMERARCDLLRFAAGGGLKSDALARRVIFQVLWTLAALQAGLGRDARHNDTGVGNVLVRRQAAPARTYRLGGRVWCLKRGLDTCLSDWDFLNAPQKGLQNARVGNGRYGIGSGANPSYDARLFLCSVWRHVNLDSLPATRRWLQRLRLGPRARLESYSKRLDPRALLRSKYFAVLLTTGGSGGSTQTRQKSRECGAAAQERYVIV